jgi:uncharacterized protein DUF6511
MEAAWWDAAFGHLGAGDRKKLARESRDRSKATAKRHRLGRPMGRIDMKTEMERTAIKEARRALYGALVDIGVADAFNDRTGDQMGGLIERVWDALRASMQRQSARGEFPI